MAHPTKKFSWIDSGIDRRQFLKASGAAAASAAVFLAGERSYALATGQVPPDTVDTDPEVVFRYTTCQNCHAKCGLRAKVVDGVLVKLDGNPYHPHNADATTDQHLPYATVRSIGDATPSAICPKGQAGVQVLYDPLRVKNPLKRVGNRGSGEWEVISWTQADQEISTKLAQWQDLVTPIDAAVPELGPIANQVLFAPGRFPHGHKEFGDRIFKGGYGTVNYRHDHTSICETSHHVAGDLRTWDRIADKKGKHHWKPDIDNCEYIIFFGANVLEANFNMVALARKLMNFKAGGGSMVVVDPRFSNAAAKADQWVPVIPGGDAALALGMARHIIDNTLYDATYLQNTTKAAATLDGEQTWTDATYLVRLDDMTMLRADDAGLGASHDDYVVSSSSTLFVHTAIDNADLEVDTTITIGLASVDVKSVFTLLRERVQEKTVAEYSAICGVAEADIVALAVEFTSHGKKAVANAYRGPCQHTSGVYTMHSIMILNQLVGNYDWKGGNQVGGSHWDEFAGGLKTVPGGVSPTGIPITRVGKDYETDAPNLFALDGGYPAQRQWFPYATNGNYQEVLPSANDGYPYNLKALITYWNAWPYSTPAAKETFESYVSKPNGAGYDLECFVAIDTHIGETSAWADYILPDVTYLEKWAQPHPTPTVLAKASPLRQPIVGSFDGRAWNAPFEPNGTNDHVGVLPDAKHVEDILIAWAKALGLPGVGANSFTDGSSLDNAWDWAKKTIEAVASDSGFSVAEIIAKGGAFADPGTEYDGNYVTKKYGKHVYFYLEELAKQKDSITGLNWDGLPKYEPATYADGTLVDDSAQYPYRIITYKHVLHAMARTACLPWLMAMQPENFVEINSADATVLGLESGDEVKLTSPSNLTGIIGKAKVTEGIRPGVVAVQHSYGHWQVGSVTHKEDGVAQDFDPSRGTGLASNLVMRQDDVIGNVSLQDRVGGSASFYDSNVNITKVI